MIERKNTNEIGIYGIFVDDKIVYIGKTTTSFKKRYQQHLTHVKNNDPTFKYEMLRKYKEEGCHIYLRPLITVEQLSVLTNRVIDKEVLGWIELSFIIYFKPELNDDGIYHKYKF